MLQSIREKSQGWLAWVIVGLISIPFALWGVNSYIGGGTNVSVAEVNGNKIGLAQFQSGMQTYRQQLQAMFGTNVDVNSLDQEAVKQTVVNGLVEQELLKQTGLESGMRVSDTQVGSVIQTLRPFQDDSGKFSNAIYESQLRQSGISPSLFQQQLREEVLQDQLRRGISESDFVTPDERQQIQQLQQQQRDIVYTIIDAEPLKESIEISDNEISEYYEENKENFKTEESVKIQYIDLSVDALAKKIDISDDVLEESYNTNLDKYTLEERRIADHILISLAPEASDDEVEKAQESGQKLIALVNQGMNFNELPEKHDHLLADSDEVGTTGEVLQGVMAPEFDEALFNLKENEISKLVRSESGFHIIKLVEVKPSETESFADVKADLEQDYRREQAEAKYYDAADELQNLTFENPDTLEIAAGSLELEVIETESFTQTTGEGISREPKVLSAAFSEEVLGGTNSEPLELTDERLVVLRSEDYQPATIKELSEIRDEIELILKNSKAKQQAQELGKSLLSKLDDGSDLEQLAKGESFEWTKKEAITRDDPQVQRAILRSAYKLGRPTSDKPVFDGIPLGLNNYAVVGVTDVFQPDDKQAANAEKEAAISKKVEDLQTQRGTTAWQDFISTLKNRSEIKVFSESF